jgi:hypothetical protein
MKKTEFSEKSLNFCSSDPKHTIFDENKISFGQFICRLVLKEDFNKLM